MRNLNAQTETQLFDAYYEQDKSRLSALLQDPDKPFYYAQRGAYWYDFHQDDTNPKGLWRRVTSAVIPDLETVWEAVFDLDRFCQQEGHNWVWRGVATSHYDPDQVMLTLSDDGSDRLRFIEFDCARKAIVENGFDLPAAKASVNWYTPDSLLICTSEGAGNATTSGWPRVAKLATRGAALDQAETVFEADKSDVALYCHVESHVTGAPTVFFIRLVDIGMSRIFGGTKFDNLTEIDVPQKAGTDLTATHFMYSPDEAGTFPAGSLVLGQMDLPNGALKNPKLLLAGGGLQFLGQFYLTKNWAYWRVHQDLVPRLYKLNLKDPFAEPQEIILPEGFDFAAFCPINVDYQSGDDRLLITLQGLLQPPTNYCYDPDNAAQPLQLLRRSPAKFDASGLEVHLNYATSDDGTKIPYHIALPRDHSAKTPVQIYAYGGYGSSVYPFHYLANIGKSWLERGGGFAVAYIRGGAEFGPDWHLTTKRHNRHKCFEDFKSVAHDIAKRGLSSPARIACQGGSNGGLLTGVMLTRYPEYFGAIISQVPVLDMTRFHLFAAGQAWIDEYGDPEDAADREYLLGYSPFHQIKPAADISYPPVLFSTHHSDDRVDPSHARRMVAKLRTMGHEPLFYESRTGGHGGGGDLESTASNSAMVIAFLRQTIGKDVMG